MTENKILNAALTKAEYDTAKARLFQTMFDETARDRYDADLMAYFIAREAWVIASRPRRLPPLTKENLI